jgi:hypothetical protein
MTREQFISDLSHWNSYLPVLWEALQYSHGWPVVELGMGDGSTKKLHDYCLKSGSGLYSYESDHAWFKRFEHLRTFEHELVYVGNNWQIMQEQQCDKNIGVLFSDEAPGEMRKYNISMFCNTAQIIVAHDTEDASDHGYKMSLVAPLFKYVKRFEFKGVGTTAFSNFVDVTKWTL